MTIGCPLTVSKPVRGHKIAGFSPVFTGNHDSEPVSYEILFIRPVIMTI